jgi:iron complex outermembrane receptor protein
VRNQSLTGALYLYPGTGNRVVYAGGFTRAKYVNLTVVSRLQADHWDSWYQQLRGNFANVLGLGSFFVQGYYTRNDAGDSYYLDILARSQIPVAAGGPGLTPDAAMQRARFVDKSDRIDVEVQHSAHIGGHHFVTSGVQWREIRPVSEGTYLTDGPTDPGIQIDEGGGYVAYDNTMLPRVRVTAVGRFDTHSDLGSRFSPRLSVSYTPVAAHLLRASYSRAFNSPTTYLLYARSFVGRTAAGQNIFVRGNRAGWSFVNTAGGTVPDRLEPLTPLNVESVEAGYRGALGDRVFLDATVYRTVYWNYISKESDISRPPDSVFALDPASGQILRELTRTYLNYGELPVLGADLGVQLALDRFSVSGSASWQRPGTFRKPVAGLAPPAFNAPEWKYKVSGAWRGWAGPESYLEVSGVRVNQFFFQSSLPYLTGTVPTYHVLDLDAGAALPRWGFARTRLAVSVKNLLDEAHIEVPGGAELGRVASVGITVEW